MKTPTTSLARTQGRLARYGRLVALLGVCTLITVGIVWLASPMSPFLQTASVAPAPQALVPLPAVEGPARLRVERLVRQDQIATDHTPPATPEQTPARPTARSQVGVEPAADQAPFVPTPPTPAATPRMATGQPTPDPVRPARENRDRRDNDDAARNETSPTAADTVANIQYQKLDMALQQALETDPATPVRVILRTAGGDTETMTAWLAAGVKPILR